jgi:hypothetical protein
MNENKLKAVLHFLIANTLALLFVAVFYHDFTHNTILEIPYRYLLLLGGLLVIMFRLYINKFGYITYIIGAFIISIVVYYLYTRKLSNFFPNQKSFYFFCLALLVIAILIDTVLHILKVPRFKIIRIRFPEQLIIVVFSCMMYLLLEFYPWMQFEKINMAIIIATMSMVTLFLKFSIDKFGTITYIFFILSSLSAIRYEFGKTDLLFGETSGLFLVFCGTLTGFILDFSMAFTSIKNAKLLLKKGVNIESVMSVYSEKSNHILYVVVFGLLAPATLFFTTNGFLYSEEIITNIGISILISICAGLVAAILYQDLSGSILLNFFKPYFKQVGKFEYERWISACEIYDIDEDGVDEVFIGCADYKLHCIKQGTGQFTIDSDNIISFCKVGSLGSDNNKYILVGSYDGTTRCYDTTGKELWRNNIQKWVWCGAIGDFFGDGDNKLVIGGFDDHLHCYDESGKEVWFAEFESWLGCCAMGVLDGGDYDSLVAGSNDGTLRCYKNGIEIWQAQFEDWVNACAIGDVDGDGKNEVLAASTDGTIRCYKNEREIWRRNILGTVGTIDISDIDNDGKNEIILGCGDGSIRILKDQHEIWAKEFYKYPNCVASGDIDGDGVIEFISGDWEGYLRHFKYARV